jgi:5-methylthioadenosine/S-adenosylhomocysteine deaminase
VDADKDKQMGDNTYSLSEVTLVTPDKVYANTSLTITDGHIASLGHPIAGRAVNLADHLVFPGLINAHDHLFGTWWPRVAPNRPYANVYEWLADYEQSPVLRIRGRNPVDDMYEFGAYRNLISGVTTVADHFKRIDGERFYTRRPIDVLYKYGRTWTPRHLTGWGDDVPTEYGRAVQTHRPYIIHLAEGIDKDTAQEMDILVQYDAVGRNTMVIHGVGLRSQDMRMLAKAGASVCWCPASNLYLYEQTANIRALEETGVNVALGTDSSMTGGLNLLDEARIGREAYRAQTGQDLPARQLVEMMTTRAAYALMLDDRRGRLQEGYEADLLVLPGGEEAPYETLVKAEPVDIALVMRGGIPVYGDLAYHELFSELTPNFVTVVVSGKPKLVVGDLLGLIGRMSAKVGEPIDFPFLPCTAPTPASSTL